MRTSLVSVEVPENLGPDDVPRCGLAEGNWAPAPGPCSGATSTLQVHTSPRETTAQFLSPDHHRSVKITVTGKADKVWFFCIFSLNFLSFSGSCLEEFRVKMGGCPLLWVGGNLSFDPLSPSWPSPRMDLQVQPQLGDCRDKPGRKGRLGPVDKLPLTWAAGRRTLTLPSF